MADKQTGLVWINVVSPPMNCVTSLSRSPADFANSTSAF